MLLSAREGKHVNKDPPSSLRDVNHASRQFVFADLSSCPHNLYIYVSI